MVPYNKKFDIETEKEICEKYIAGKTTTELAKEYGYKGRKSISDILKRHNISRRNVQAEQSRNTRYSNFSLEKIDTPEKAYFLGLLITDGYLIKNDASYTYLTGLSMTDIDTIEYISQITGCKKYEVKPRNKMTKPAFRIHLFGKRYILQLERLGVYPKKTYDVGKINLSPEENQFFKYVLRGIIDGDGWIRKDGKEFFISSASENFMKYLVEEMKNVGFDVNYKFYENEYNGYYLIRSGKKENIKLLKEVVYDIPFGMNEKYNKLHNL